MATKSARALVLAGIAFSTCLAAGDDHIKRQSSSGRPLIISNQCNSTIWPGIDTNGGTGPSQTGFQLLPGANQTLSVSNNWQGRVWGRTNCSFSNAQGCTTGDCGGILACKGPGNPPATLAEFTLDGGTNQDFYDMSLVDGYNLPMAITMQPNGISALEQIDPSTTNPSCVASIGDLAPANFNPYANNQQFLGTSSSSPLPFITNSSASTVAQWCPWDLQVNPPYAPGAGVYPYPDTNIVRPTFNPCYSACAKYNQPNYCCTGQYDGPSKCSPNYYATAAKNVCPDAYSYAYDDKYSTFITPAGAGFTVIFCPGGRSTNIIGSKGSSAINHG